jgi:hypothetical protein
VRVRRRRRVDQEPRVPPDDLPPRQVPRWPKSLSFSLACILHARGQATLSRMDGEVTVRQYRTVAWKQAREMAGGNKAKLEAVNELKAVIEEAARGRRCIRRQRYLTRFASIPNSMPPNLGRSAMALPAATAVLAFPAATYRP